jgi:hypothetical protein
MKLVDDRRHTQSFGLLENEASGLNDVGVENRAISGTADARAEDGRSGRNADVARRLRRTAVTGCERSDVSTVTERVLRLVSGHGVIQELVQIVVTVDGAFRLLGAAVFGFELRLAITGRARKIQHVPDARVAGFVSQIRVRHVEPRVDDAHHDAPTIEPGFRAECAASNPLVCLVQQRVPRRGPVQLDVWLLADERGELFGR